MRQITLPMLQLLHIYSVVSITAPPENITVCRGSDVTISCGYDSDTPLDPVWQINRTIFLQPSQIMNMSSYQENNPTTTVNYSLTIFSINATTEIRCVITSRSLNVTAALSPMGTVTVIGMCIMYVDCTICEITCCYSLSISIGKIFGKMVSTVISESP